MVTYVKFPQQSTLTCLLILIGLLRAVGHFSDWCRVAVSIVNAIGPMLGHQQSKLLQLLLFIDSDKSEEGSASDIDHVLLRDSVCVSKNGYKKLVSLW